jgi:hypothetical protein
MWIFSKVLLYVQFSFLNAHLAIPETDDDSQVGDEG